MGARSGDPETACVLRRKLPIAEFVPQLVEHPAIFAGFVGAGVASGDALLQRCGVVYP